VFAGAAREAVFSNPAVIRRVNADFVPVALKAALVNNPPDDEEGRLCREIGRSKPAPQGICVANSAGKVLDWVLMFDDDQDVPAFLDHALKRFARYPDAKQPVPAERYMKFPSAKLEDVEDNGKTVPVAERHPEGKSCPAKPPLRPGTVVARLFGRALDKDGKPVDDAVRQEHYVEDRFNVTVPVQETLARALADAGSDRFRIADNLARLLVSHAYLGQLDVNPVDAPGGKGSLKQCEFWAQKVDAGGKGPARIRVEGTSEAAGASRDGEGGDGRLWQHEVKLVWEGLIEVQQEHVTRLLLLARGSEKLKWGNKLQPFKGEADVNHLPAGHPIDLACDVRYGILGEPAASDEVGAAGTAEPDQVPDEARRQITEALGPPFSVFRNKVQEELKLSDEQKKKLEQQLQDTAQDAMKFFEKIKDLKPEERDKEHQAYRQKAQEKLATFLKETLKEGQRQRLRQLELQQEGIFALFGDEKLQAELKITDEQRKKFMGVIEDLQKKTQPLIKEAQSGGKPEEIGPKMMKIRKEQEGKIEAVLTDAQKKQWQEILGKPFPLDD
jgi:hypothetical protein